MDTLSILEALQTGARVRLFGFNWEIEDSSEIEGILDTLDDKRGLDQNGDNVPTAQVYGSIYVPSVTGSIIAHARTRYPDITIINKRFSLGPHHSPAIPNAGRIRISGQEHL